MIMENINERINWCKLFVQMNGLSYLFEILTSHEWLEKRLENNFSQSDSVKEPLPQQKNCLALILKIIDFFMHSFLGKEDIHEEQTIKTKAQVCKLFI